MSPSSRARPGVRRQFKGLRGHLLHTVHLYYIKLYFPDSSVEFYIWHKLYIQIRSNKEVEFRAVQSTVLQMNALQLNDFEVELKIGLVEEFRTLNLGNQMKCWTYCWETNTELYSQISNVVLNEVLEVWRALHCPWSYQELIVVLGFNTELFIQI